MKIAVIGAGAMGSIYAGLLAEANNEVWIVDIWKQHLDTIRSQGLRVEGASGDRVVKNINVADDVSEIGECELVVIATKASGVASAATSIGPLLNDRSVVLTIQNGLGAGERIRESLDSDNIIIGVAGGFGASMKAPGHTHHNGMELIRLGEIQGGITSRLEEVTRVWDAAGFKVKMFEDINQLIWEKFVCNVTFSGPCTVFQRNLGQLMADPNSWQVALGCAREAFAVGKAEKINFGFDDVDAYVTAFGKKMPESKPSMFQDILAQRHSEIDAINGMVPVLAAQSGLQAPYNEVISSIVRAKESEF
jgi:2-dehydropantoate 2-reductase